MAFLSKLKSALGKSSGKLSEGITTIFTHRKLDDTLLDELEELLIEADLGVNVATEVVEQLRERKFHQDIAGEEVKQHLAEYFASLLAPVAKPLEIIPAHHPHVIMMVGVNGNGKTTTIGKLAHQWTQQGKTVMLAAADTFRAAAAEQLQIWANRCNVPLVRGEPESDPASVAFNALQQAKANGTDILLIDTAGRLQNKSNLMAELQKIIRVIQKLDPETPHNIIQVVDATTGQNAISQIDTFKNLVNVSGLVVTKLDGTAKGGIVIALANRFSLPIHAVGVGESLEDLDSFNPSDFARGLIN